MSESILVISADKLKIQHWLDNKVSEYDLGKIGENYRTLVPETTKSIGIQQIKDTNAWISQKPFNSKHKLLIIPNADKLTLQAQNSLLKTLEEPPTYASIILVAQDDSSLLDTIKSRCKRVKLQADISSEITQIYTSNNNDWLAVFSEWSKLDKDEIIDKLKELVLYERDEMLKLSSIEDSAKYAQNIKVINKVMQDLLKTNMNTKFCLEYLAVMLQ